MKVYIYVTLKAGVLDPQGQATEHALKHLGFDGVSSARIGKYIELDVADTTQKSDVVAMCEGLLANTVVESYRIEMSRDAA
ncbi:MAG: phosphoribosylformylglycinamidine synthase subunit PurS [Alphaproteobacteria bacterium]|nr:MAG: phosphoribosylformylglycinamidine synthase subunit PurS [Alphaproteobacteria bacterium]TAF12640.1 MAG: phosphoribosylformylglycinamidine synthase subunit PurS [Alphaproteobacteria bacterium]TAF40650.1 MAG: phosphoribosylformylglycinamidine synthase subunit PurS [Alphaproteobacteria bacterium]TAF77383.1 MAG: phosphoribosylformylglycinamidine synthase subunit PurS [Alphaproteobacteria bacterium]